MTYYPDGASTTYSISGKLNSGKFTPLITYHTSNGYNLVPNPFSSTIDWNSNGGWKKDGINGTIYIWPAGTSSPSTNYASFNGTTGVNGGSQYIALGQSFIVQASSGTIDFSMTNAVCTNHSATFLKDKVLIPNLLRIQSVAMNNNASDEIAIHFRDGATSGFNPAFDGNKLTGGADAPQLSTVASDNSELCINSLPFSTGDVIVPMHFSFSANSDISFTASGMQSFTPGVSILLEDQSLNKVTNLRQDSVYNFTYHTADPIDRFRLRFSGSIGIQEEQISNDGRAFVSNHFLFLDISSMQGQTADVRVYSILGQLVSSDHIQINGIARVEAPQSAGIYIVEVVAPDHRFVSRIVCK